MLSPERIEEIRERATEEGYIFATPSVKTMLRDLLAERAELLAESLGEHRTGGAAQSIAQPEQQVVERLGLERGLAPRQLGLDELVAEACRTREAGVPAVLLFGIPEVKAAVGSF